MYEPGLHTIYDGLQEDTQGRAPEVDVVAVHGLNFKNNPNHARATWTWSATGAFWVRDFLPSHLKRSCRILLFAYNSSPAMGAVAMTIDDHARELLQCLGEKREGDSQRPIVFLCHSMGGLVVKAALVEAKLDPSYRSIVHSTRLLAFFATPHLGGKHSGIGDIAARIVRVGLGTPSNDLLDGLKAGSRDVTRRFDQARHLLEGCLVISFYETQNYGRLGIIVEKSSAVLGLPEDREAQVALDADHSKVCKFPAEEAAIPVMSRISSELERALDLQRVRELKNNVHWLVPRRTSPLFTGREDVVTRVISAISPNTDLSVHQKVFVLTGLGGQGKSEICLHVVNQVRSLFWAVFWVDVSNRATASTGFAQIARAVGSDKQDIDQVLLWLSNCNEKNRWLLVLDNADNEDIDYSELMPTGSRGTVLMTSRMPECQLHSTAGHEEIGSLGEADCSSLILKASRIPQDLWPGFNAAAAVITKELGFHTLALVQAGAYIALGRCSMEEYPSLFQRQKDELLKFGSAQLRSRYRNVYATFEVSVQTLIGSKEESAQDALELLDLFSVMNHDDIPLELFNDIKSGKASAATNSLGRDMIDSLSAWHVRELPSFLATEDSEQCTIRFTHALKRLTSLALVRASTERNGLEMLSLHPLVHDYLAIRQTPEQRLAPLKSCLSLFSLWQYGELGWKPYRDRLGPHLSSLLGSSDFVNEAMCQTTMRQSFFQIGRLLHEIRYHPELEALIGVIFRHLNLRLEHPTTGFLHLYLLAALNQSGLGNISESIRVLERISEDGEIKEPKYQDLDRMVREALAAAYVTNGQSKKAVAMLEGMSQDLERRCNIPADVQASLKYRMAVAYRSDSQQEKALTTLEEVVRRDSETLKRVDPAQAAAAYELARGFLAAGRTRDAIRLLEDTIEQQKDYLPEAHPTMLSLRAGLARALIADSQPQAAIEILEEVDEIGLGANGSDHPNRLARFVTLGTAYQANGQTQKAIEVFDEALRLSKFDEGHPNRLDTQYELSIAYLAQGQTKKAISLLEKTKSMQEKTMEHDHPTVVRVRTELGNAYSQAGQYKKAIRLLENAAEIQNAKLDEAHPNRLGTQYQLGLAYLNDGQVKRAIDTFWDIVCIEASSLEETSPDRAVSKLALGRAFLTDGRPREAVGILEGIVPSLQSSRGHSHPDVLAAKHELARSYFAIGKVLEARTLFEQVVEAQKKSLPAHHPDQLASQRLLSLTLLQLGENEEALALLQKVADLESSHGDQNAESALATRRALAKALLANGQAQKAVNQYEAVMQVQSRSLAANHPDALDTKQQLGSAYLSLNRAEDAITCLKQAVAGYAGTLEPCHTARLTAGHRLAKAYIQGARKEDAMAVLEEIVRNAAHLGAGHPNMLAFKYDLAQCYLQCGRPQEAVTRIKEVLAVEDAMLQKDDPSRIKTVRLLGYAYLSLGSARDAIGCFAEISLILSDTFGAKDARYLSAQNDLAVAYVDDCQPKKAIPILREALTTAREAAAPGCDLVMKLQYELATAHTDAKRPDRAIPLLEEIVQIKLKDATVAYPSWEKLRASLADAHKTKLAWHASIALRPRRE